MRTMGIVLSSSRVFAACTFFSSTGQRAVATSILLGFGSDQDCQTFFIFFRLELALSRDTSSTTFSGLILVLPVYALRIAPAISWSVKLANSKDSPLSFQVSIRMSDSKS